MTLAYNAANRLRSLTLSGGQALTFAYSALGERVAKTSAQGTTHFHYDLAGHLIAESDATGAVIREYLWLGDKPLALVAKRNAGTTFELFAVHTDHLDTALALTDSTQQVVWQYAREPFGKLAAGGNTVRWNLRFPGQYQDSETGLFYNYYRNYDPQTGRYIESDPIGLAGGINTYAYVGGNPLALTDFWGLFDSLKYANQMIRKANRKSQGKCAKYVRRGMEAGGADTTGHPISAKDYGPILINNGFIPVSSEDYVPMIGDTVIFQPYNGGSLHGHIQMYDGVGWLSDFYQKRFFPGQGYQDSEYQIYRAPDCGCEK